jgi:hypothetical protein
VKSRFNQCLYFFFAVCHFAHMGFSVVELDKTIEFEGIFDFPVTEYLDNVQNVFSLARAVSRFTTVAP